MTARTTKLLAMLVAVSLAAAVVACVHLRDVRASAAGQADDLRRVEQLLSEIAAHGGGGGGGGGAGGAATASAGSNDSALGRRLHAAAVAAAVVDRMTSVEPGQPARVRDSDFVETPLYVRLDGVSLRDTVSMLTSLCAANPNVGVKSIELSPPATSAIPSTQPSGEAWTADLTIVGMTYSPKR
jgi:hypothetical protein